jgi:ATP-dependent exoDNAse (exonuclease V) alpha subunit
MKTCCTCKETKSKSEFCNCKSTKDGLGWQCKLCNKAYRDANKNQIHLKDKVWRDANKESRATYAKSYNIVNKKQIALVGKVWRDNNIERHRANAKIWDKANPEQKLASLHKRRALKKNSKGSYRRQAWDEFYAFRNYNLLMSDLYTESGKLITSKDIDYAFGLTVHKTQGSTFSNIFVNVNDIIYNKYGVPYSNIGLRNRLIYVALSRARNSAFILT